MTQEMDKYKDLFVEESKERLDELDRQILALEKDPTNRTYIADMFRTAHTFKGMAATMGYQNLAHLTHQMENLMDLIKTNEAIPDEETFTLLFECRDHIENGIRLIEQGQNDSGEDPLLLEKLTIHIKKYADGNGKKPAKPEKTAQPEKIAQPIKNDIHSSDDMLSEKLEQYQEEFDLGDDIVAELERATEEKISAMLIRIKLLKSTEMPYARAYLCIKKIKDFANILKIHPEEEVLKEEAFNNEFSIICLMEDVKKIKYLKQDLESVAAVENVRIIPINNIERKVQKETRDKTVAKDRELTVQNVKVSIRHLDNLMNLAGELLIAKIRLDRFSQDNHGMNLNETLALINRITFDLQDEVLRMRMIPVAQIFDRFPRMVRDLTKSLNKLIDFSMEGREIELDRTIIDQIGDPIVHLLRNGIDHAIEMPDEREAMGKPRIGSLRLLAYRDRNFVVIEVSDDGKGIDFDRIKEKAMKKGLITQEDAQKMTDYDLKRLLLGGGISTAQKVSEISGRGVGLGVVKQKIESLGGLIDVESRIGNGTTFRLKLPLTVAIIKSLLVSLGTGNTQEIYAIPITNVVRTIVIRDEEIRTIKNKEVITILGKIVSLVRLRELTAFTNQNEKDQFIEKDHMKTVIVIERGGMEVGLLVDNLIGQQEIVIKSLGTLLKGVNGISGGALLGDGKVALIVDVSSLF